MHLDQASEGAVKGVDARVKEAGTRHADAGPTVAGAAAVGATVAGATVTGAAAAGATVAGATVAVATVAGATVAVATVAGAEAGWAGPLAVSDCIAAVRPMRPLADRPMHLKAAPAASMSISRLAGPAGKAGKAVC